MPNINIRNADQWEREWKDLQEKLQTIVLRSFSKKWGGDEIVAENATVHLEQMDERNYYLGIDTATGYLLVNIGSNSGRARVRAVAYEGGRHPTTMLQIEKHSWKRDTTREMIPGEPTYPMVCRKCSLKINSYRFVGLPSTPKCRLAL